MRNHIKALITAFLLVASTAAMGAATHTELAPHWRAHSEDSDTRIDHSAFAAFLDNYVIERDHAANLVRYAKVTQDAHDNLEAYIAQLAKVTLSDYSRDVQLAYWINLYNAALLDLVLNHYPVKSVTAIGGQNTSPWAIPVVRIDGYPLTLNDIRQRILKPIWNAPLVGYGLSWAAMGGPELRAEPYSADGIFLQLRNSAERFINSPQGLTIKDSHLIVSRFFDWNRADFGDTTIALISQLREHAQPALSARLDIFDKISRFKFNWQLNDAATHQS